MNDLVARIQRELPDTDKTRYDVAYERGRAQARSRLLFGGLLAGSALGAGLMWLLDPTKGADRRAMLTARADALRQEIGKRTARDTDTDTDEWPAAPVAAGTDTRFGAGYEVGFGQTQHDPTAPGSQVDDPLRPEEVAEHGSSGPVAGATMDSEEPARV